MGKKALILLLLFILLPVLLKCHCSKQCILSHHSGMMFTYGLQFHSNASADHCLERLGIYDVWVFEKRQPNILDAAE